MKVALKTRLGLVGMIGLCILTSGCKGPHDELIEQLEAEIAWWQANPPTCNGGCNHNHGGNNNNQTPVCEIKEFKKKFAVRKLHGNEKHELNNNLPYNSCDVPTLDIGEGNKQLKSCRKGCDLSDRNALTGNSNCSNSCTFPIAEQKFVQDAMVVFAADLENLPPRDKIKEVNAANLALTLAQKDENQLIGEMLCIIGSGVCSGAYDMGWVGQKINAAFFQKHDLVNDYFSKIMLKKQLRCKEERRTCAADVDAFSEVIALTGNHNSCTASHVLWYDHVQMKIEDLIAGSNKSVLDIIYGNQNNGSKRTLKFVIADDVYVPSKDGYVELSVKYESCEVPQPCTSPTPSPTASPTPTPTPTVSPTPTPTPPIGT
jgi:hypothetical protein